MKLWSSLRIKVMTFMHLAWIQNLITEVIQNLISNRFCDRHLSQDAVYAVLVDLVRYNMKGPETGFI